MLCCGFLSVNQKTILLKMWLTNMVYCLCYAHVYTEFWGFVSREGLSPVGSRQALTHWGPVTHTCVSSVIIIASDNGLSPGRRQVIVWTNAGVFAHFHSRKCIRKCRPENGGHFVRHLCVNEAINPRCLVKWLVRSECYRGISLQWHKIPVGRFKIKMLSY